MKRDYLMRAATAAACASIALVAACTSVPRASNELDSARAAYRVAAADPQVQARAQTELQLAERELRDAENLASADADPARVAHFAYLAEQRARIAVKTAEQRAAEVAYQMANDQRQRMQLELGSRAAAQSSSSGQTAPAPAAPPPMLSAPPPPPTLNAPAPPPAYSAPPRPAYSVPAPR
jgi:Domain of unknown function (DUF4398)